jgi:hypothetical protein
MWLEFVAFTAKIFADTCKSCLSFMKVSLSFMKAILNLTGAVVCVVYLSYRILKVAA